MKTFYLILMAGVILLCASCKQPEPVSEKVIDPEAEKEMIGKVIYNSIGWALTKDTVALYESLSDSNLFIFHPDSIYTVTDISQLRETAEKTVESARERLRLLGLSQAQIAEIEKRKVFPAPRRRKPARNLRSGPAIGPADCFRCHRLPCGYQYGQGVALILQTDIANRVNDGRKQSGKGLGRSGKIKNDKSVSRPQKTICQARIEKDRFACGFPRSRNL